MVDIIAKKKIKNDGIYFIGQNADDVTGSCILIKFNGKQILLEAGLYQSNDILEAYKVNTEKFKFNPSEIDYCFIAHAHLDHIGLLPRLVKEGFKGKIITSRDTAIFFKSMLSNSAFILGSEARLLTKKYKRDYSPIYDEEDVYRMLDFVYEYDAYHTVFKLDDVVSFKWLTNSHCVGAKQLQLYLTNSSNVKTPILYTSDIGGLKTQNHYVQPTEKTGEFNKYVIMESTYGERGRINKKTREFDVEHLRVAINTVTERGGRLILPAFSFSRTQELLTTLYDIYHNDKQFKYDIVVDSKLSCEISKLYDDALKGSDLGLWRKVSNWDRVKFIEDKVDSTECLKDKTPKIVISSSGFCSNGRVLNYLQEYLIDDKNMVVFSGYTGKDASYLSYRIKNYDEFKVVKINKKPIENKADCITMSTFSSHASRDDLLEIGSELSCESLILVHGSENAKKELAEDLKKRISNNNKTYKVKCANKDMVLHL